MGEAKDYVSRKEIPQLFECLMTGLMYHQPQDHIVYLQNCLEKIKVQGVQNVRWDLFLEAKRSKTPLPPISPAPGQVEKEGSQVLSREPSINEASVLPPIQKEPAPLGTEDSFIQLQVPDNVPIVILLGAPGSGKGTVASLLTDRYDDLIHVSMGEILRKNTTTQGNVEDKWQMAASLVQKGEMAPEEVTSKLLIDTLNSNASAKGILVEGYPRTVSQVEEWNSLVGRVDYVYLLDCEEEYCQERLLRRGHTSGRSDDNPTAIAKRLAFFKHHTLPVCKHFDDIGKLSVIPLDGAKEPADVFGDVTEEFDKIFAPRQGARKEVVSNVQLQPSGIVRPSSAVSGELQVPGGIPVVVLLATPGCGNQAVAKMLVDRYDSVQHVSMGAALSSSHGEVSEDDTAQLLKDGLSGCSASGILVEGLPRTISQVEQWDQLVGRVDYVFLLDCEEDACRERLTNRGGADDTPEIISDRLDFFRKETIPVCKHFDDQEKLTIVPVSSTIEAQDIFSSLVEIFDKIFTPKAGAARVAPVPRPPSTPKPGQRSRPMSSASRASPPPVAPVVDIRELQNVAEDPGRLDGMPQCPILLLIGGPGSGRSEQAAKICERYEGFKHISFGEEVVKQALDTDVAIDAWDSLLTMAEKGELGPAELSIDLLKSKIMEAGEDAKCLIVEGVPMNGDHLNLYLNHIGRLDLSILLDCQEYYMTTRLLNRGKETGSVHDNLAAIGKRLKFFKEHTLPVIRYLDEQGKLCILLGDRDRDEVFFDIASLIDYAFFKQVPQGPVAVEEEAAEKIQAAFKGYATRRAMSQQKIKLSEKSDDTTENNVVEVDNLEASEEETGVGLLFGSEAEDDVVEEEVVPEAAKNTGELEGTIPNMSKEALKDAKVVFVLGGPGSGKGTQCEKIVEKYGYTHLSSGDLLRAEVASGSERGKELNAIMEKGELVSMDIVLELIRDKMCQLVDKNPCFLIDGYPRDLDQGKRFEAEVAPCSKVIYFDVSEDVMKERLLKRGETSGRADDNEETIVSRFQTFTNSTKPVIEYYKEQGKVTEIDASPDKDTIFTEVCTVLDS